jgi:4-hydroxybenzoate polyprenyltransferase
MTAAAFLRACRAPNAPTAAADAYAGAFLAGLSFDDWRVHVVASGSALLYMGGVALGDVVDADKDRVLHPERPIPSGAISKRALGIFGAALLCGGAATGFVAGPLALGATAATLASISAYVFGRGARGVRSSSMAAARASNLLRGSAIAGAFGSEALLAGCGHAAAIGLLTVVSGFEETPERARGPRFALLLGAFGLSYAAPAIVGFSRAFDGASFAATALAIGVALFVVRPFEKERSSPGRVVFRGVFTWALVDAAYVVAANRPLLGLGVAALAPASALLKRLVRQRGS